MPLETLFDIAIKAASSAFPTPGLFMNAIRSTQGAPSSLEAVEEALIQKTSNSLSFSRAFREVDDEGAGTQYWETRLAEDFGVEAYGRRARTVYSEKLLGRLIETQTTTTTITSSSSWILATAFR